jgi:hypothetical protein
MRTDVLVHPTQRVQAPAAPVAPSPRAALGWFAGGSAVMFAASFIASDVSGLHHDLYLLIYFTAALVYLGWFATKSGVAWRALLRTNIWWSLGVGALAGAAVIRQVLSQDGTGHPTGPYFVFELVWRGVVYGAVDALVLAVFPALVAYLLLRGNRNGVLRKVVFAGLVLLVSLTVTAAYHAGYSTYRGSTMSKPLTGAVMWDLPAVLTGSPAGAVVAHAAVHATAVVHQYYGGDNRLLPPDLGSDYPERAGGTLGQLLAVGWLALVAGVLLTTRDRGVPPMRRRTQ